jgi:hypothetical protein
MKVRTCAQALQASSSIALSLFVLSSPSADSITDVAATGKIAAQWPLDKKVALADTVIENNGSMVELHKRLDDWCTKHRAQQRNQPWREWIPTVPTMIFVALAAPILLALNACARWMWM